MPILFGDLYEEMITLEKAITRMRTDIANAECDSDTKCILIAELEMLEQKAYNLGMTEFEFEKLNFATVIESIERCMNCIEFESDIGDLAPSYGSSNKCGSKRRQLTLDNIEHITVYETSGKMASYKFNKAAMPHQITIRENERITVAWDSLRDGISIKLFNGSAGFAEIGQVEVTLNEPAQKKYGKKTIAACKVILGTNTPSSNLANGVDGNKNTYITIPKSKNPNAELIFQFFA